jgi:type II secretory pathway pseudopilin PulG
VLCALGNQKRNSCRSHSAGAGRRAFTLVEVVLALGLSVALLAAVYSALDLYRQFTTASQTEIDRAQLARSILRMIERDIRSCVYVSSDQESASISSASGDGGFSGGDSSDTGSNSDSDALVTVDPVEGLSTNTTGLMGDSQTLIMNVSRPSRDAIVPLVSESESGAVTQSDQKTVAYFLAAPNQAGLEDAVGDEFAIDGPDSPTAHERGGLARRETNALQSQFADSEMSTVQTRILSSEIDSLQFRYFDGFDLLEQWSGTSSAGLPTAIEVTIGFRAVENDRRNSRFEQKIFESTAETFRLVINVPLAN